MSYLRITQLLTQSYGKDKDLLYNFETLIEKFVPRHINGPTQSDGGIMFQSEFK